MLPSFNDNVAQIQNMIASRAAARQAAQTNSANNDDNVFAKMLAAKQADQANAPANPLQVVANAAGVQHAPTQPGAAAIPRALAQPKGSLKQWIDQALNTLHLDKSFEPGLASLIQHESGGNPNAINNWDSNAKAGHPSQGLMQTIPGTFAEYALPGHGQILNPIDNIIAGTRYALKNYGPNMIKSGGRHDARGNYIGY